MLLDRGLSWRYGARPQRADPPQDLGEQVSWDGDFCQLECGVAAMAHDLGSDFDQLLAQGGQRPVLNGLRQGQRPQEVAEVISERMKLQANRIVAKAAARYTH